MEIQRFHAEGLARLVLIREKQIRKNKEERWAGIQFTIAGMLGTAFLFAMAIAICPWKSPRSIGSDDIPLFVISFVPAFLGVVMYGFTMRCLNCTLKAWEKWQVMRISYYDPLHRWPQE